MTTTYQLATLTCPSCIAKIEKAVSGMEGVEQAKVLFNASKLKVDTSQDIKNDIAKTVEALGYEVLGVQ